MRFDIALLLATASAITIHQEGSPAVPTVGARGPVQQLAQVAQEDDEECFTDSDGEIDCCWEEDGEEVCLSDAIAAEFGDMDFSDMQFGLT